MEALMKTTVNTAYEGLALLGLDQADVRVLVVGLGVTGLSVVKFLSLNNIDVAVVDSRDNPPALEIVEQDYLDVAVFTGGFSEAAFEAATHIIVSPGIGLDQPLIKQAAERGVPVFGDIDVFAVCADAPVACITGSNGKSTVTTLLGEMAVSAGWDAGVGGNLGVPALDLLGFDGSESKQCDLYVLELSSFQLERTSYMNAQVSTVLNISADHMDRYADLLSYSQAKARVFHGDGVAVVNREDAAVMALMSEDQQYVTFGLDQPDSSSEQNHYGLVTKDGVCFLAKDENRMLPVCALKMSGTHNVANALAAMAMADVLLIPAAAQHEALEKFAGLEHRMETVAELNNVTWINDSKATNPGACLAALNGLNSPVILIAGGDGKGAEFGILRDAIKANVSHVVLIGQDAARFKSEAIDATSYEYAESIEEAVELAARKAISGDVVLLSPACASLDQFSNYQERGNRFINAVGTLK
jgi:UDP-N-acetylmuramoylalanine--D-glutamate ligase